MSQISIRIGGRSFAIACQPGDEEHVQKLSEWIDEKFQNLAPRYSQNLLFATLQVADDLHRAREDAATARAEADKSQQSVNESNREAELARGQNAKLEDRVRELEKELDSLQSFVQQENGKHDQLLADNERFKVAVMEADSENSRLQGELATMRRERDAFEHQLNESQAKTDQASFIDPSASPADPDLAPSLERFADLLENCVNKLEGSATNP